MQSCCGVRFIRGNKKREIRFFNEAREDNMRQITLACLAVAAVTANANAQSLPAEGPVAVTFTSTETPPGKPMSIGGGKEY
jgi:hypothetical protein